MQTAQAIQTVSFTTARKVSGGEVFARTDEMGRTTFWFNQYRIDRATAARKVYG